MGATLGFWPPVFCPNGLSPRTSHASLPMSLFPELPVGDRQKSEVSVTGDTGMAQGTPEAWGWKWELPRGGVVLGDGRGQA